VVRVDLKGWFTTYKMLKDGTRRAYFYHRATTMRLQGEPGSPEFITNFAAAEKSLKARHRGDTFNDLIRDYTTSDEFKKLLAAASQREYKRMLTKQSPSSAQCRGKPLRNRRFGRTSSIGVRRLLEGRAIARPTTGSR